MYTVEIEGRTLVLSQEFVRYGDRELAIAEVEALKVIKSDTYAAGAWVNGTRIIVIRGAERSIWIDCSRVLPSRDELDRLFADAYEPIWSEVGLRLVVRFIARLLDGETVCIAGIRLGANGVWTDGSWRFLWWKARPRLVHWTDLRIFGREGSLFLESISDVRYRSSVTINDTDNAVVLDGIVRAFLPRSDLVDAPSIVAW